ncbi:MAG: hypothetical protein SFV20_06905 [Sphingopyxis sp.]|nr:hypothetical protein [Sphingopyxis sp.]
MSDNLNIYDHADLMDQQDYGFTDETDIALAREIIAEDPLSVPRALKVSGAAQLRSFTPQLSALPPETQRDIKARLSGLEGDRRDAEETRLVGEAVRKAALSAKVLTGMGAGASEFLRESADIAYEVRTLTQEHDRLSDELAAIHGHATETDLATGEAKAVPIPAITGERRAAYEARQAAIKVRLADLAGREGQGRLRQAVAREIEARKARDAQLAEDREARERAKDIARERRIMARAEALARQEDNTP